MATETPPELEQRKLVSSEQQTPRGIHAALIGLLIVTRGGTVSQANVTSLETSHINASAAKGGAHNV